MILVSAQVLLVLTLGLRTLDFGLGLDNNITRHPSITSGSYILSVQFKSHLDIKSQPHRGFLLVVSVAPSKVQLIFINDLKIIQVR